MRPERAREERLLRVAFVLALGLHFAALFVRLPPLRHEPPPVKPQASILVRRYVPPPPPSAARARSAPSRKLERRLPVPDPTPDAPEPIAEPAPAIAEADPFDGPGPSGLEPLIGAPEGPPGAGILLSGVGGVVPPRLIEESKVSPDYPEQARIARLDGQVILEAVVFRNGTVGDMQILRCDPPGLGFEDAARAAVGRWRYVPATKDGRPVDVYFTVFVNFQLL